MNTTTIYYSKPNIPTSGIASFSECLFKQIHDIIISSSIRVELNECIFTTCASSNHILESSYQIIISSSCFFYCYTDSLVVRYNRLQGIFSIKNSDFISCSSKNMMISALYGFHTLEHYNVSHCTNLYGNLMWFDEQESINYSWINFESCLSCTIAFFDDPADRTQYEIKNLNVIDNSAMKGNFLMKLRSVSAIRNGVFQKNRCDKTFEIVEDNRITYLYDVIMDEERYITNNVMMSSGSKISITSPLKNENLNYCYINQTDLATKIISYRNQKSMLKITYLLLS